MQKAPVERPLNDVGKIHNRMKAVIEGDNQSSDETNENTAQLEDGIGTNEERTRTQWSISVQGTG